MSSHADQHEDGSEQPGQLGMRELLAIARRHLWLIGGLGIFAGIIAAAISLALPNRYEAVATVQIDQRNKKIINIDSVLSDLKADTQTLESEVEIVRSKVIAQRVIDQLSLRDDAEFVQPALLERWLAALGIRQPPRFVSEQVAFGPGRDEVAREFESRLRAQRVRNSALIEIRFASADPVKAARIVNAVAEIYITLQIETKTRATELASDLIDDKLKGLRDKVAEAERNIERFKADHNIFDADGQLLADRQLAREMEALVLARNGTAQAKSRYEQARRMMLGGEGNEAIADVLQSHTVRLLRDELTKVLRREAELATKYGPKHPEMQKVAADVAKAQSELGAEIGKIVRNLKTEFEVAGGRERQLQAGLDALKEEISRSKEKQWKLRELEREATASKQLYEALLQRNKQTAETLGFQLADARLVTHADVPLYPASPKRKQIVLLAVLAGLGIGFGLAYFIECCAAGFARPEDIEGRLGIAHLASVPLAARAAGSRNDELRLARMMIAEPRGAFAESVRALRHELDTSAPHAPGRMILVASTLPHEGKTTIASNLALAYAAAGKTTLLIDADLRTAGLSAKLGVLGQPGLFEAVVHGVRPQSLTLRDGRSGLSFLPAGNAAHDQISPAEVLAVPALVELVQFLNRHFDVIIVDAPPLLPVVDARVMASVADQIAFVVSWRTTGRTLAARALRGLGANRAKIAGAVLNQVDPQVHAAGSGYRDYSPDIPRFLTHDRKAA